MNNTTTAPTLSPTASPTTDGTPTTKGESQTAVQWKNVCPLNDISPDTGVCALHQGEQVAIFRVTNGRVTNGRVGNSCVSNSREREVCSENVLGGSSRVGCSEQVFAISNYDPIGEANVLSRGIIGSLGDRLVVASPLYKQHFDLRNGECLEDESVTLKTYPIRVQDDQIQLAC